MISTTQDAIRLLLNININTIRDAFEKHGHMVSELDDSSLFYYAIAMLRQEHEAELENDIFNTSSTNL